MRDGTIDIIATDHAPHDVADKQVEFDNACFGIVGLETALPLTLKLVDEKVISLQKAIDLLTQQPCRIFNLDKGTLGVGKDADIEYHNRHPADVLATWATVEKAYRILGWSPMTSFEDGVAKCVQWYQEHEALVRELWE